MLMCNQCVRSSESGHVLPMCPPFFLQPHVVNWIESKAMFGDHKQHGDNFYQLEKYVERHVLTDFHSVI